MLDKFKEIAQKRLKGSFTTLILSSGDFLKIPHFGLDHDC